MDSFITTQENHAVLKLSGKFVLKSRVEFMASVEKIMSENPLKVLIDMREVWYIDSAAVGMLMVTAKKLKAANVPLTLCYAEGHAKNVLDLLKIPEIIPVVSSI